MIEFLKKGRVALCRVLEVILILAVTALVLVVLWGVFTRWSGSFVSWLSVKGINAWSFLPKGQDKYSEETARFLLIWISLLGGAVAFGEKAHLGVDYFVGKFDPSARKLTTVLGQLTVLFFAITIFIMGGINIVVDNMDQLAPALGDFRLPLLGKFGKFSLKMGHVYMALPLAGIFIIIFAVEQLLEAIFTTEVNEEGK